MSEPKRQYTTEQFKRIVQFYLSCLESEDRRSHEIPLKARNRSYVAPWSKLEPLLHPASERVDFSVHSADERQFLTSHEDQAGGEDRFFYGFPLRMTASDYLVPLFILEVEIHRDRRSSTPTAQACSCGSGA